MLKIRIKNCCCCCNSSGGGSSGGNSGDNTGGEGGESTTKHLVTIGHPIDYDTNEPIDIVQNYFVISVKRGDDIENVDVGDTINVEDGDSITILVSAEEYDYFEQEYTITEPQTITPVLRLTSTEPTYYTVTVNTTPSSAEVTMNGTAGNVQQFLAGSTINIVASKDGYYDATHTIQAIARDETVPLALTREPDPYAGYRLDPNQSPTYNAKSYQQTITRGASVISGTTQVENMRSWIQGNENTDSGQLSTYYDIDAQYPPQPIGLSLELLEGSEYLDSYELIHFTRFGSENTSGNGVVLTDSSGNETYNLNLGNSTTNPEFYYRLKLKFKENLVAGNKVSFKVTQNTSGRYILYNYVVS